MYIDHVVTSIDGIYYDINGVYSRENETIRKLSDNELPVVEQWRFTNMHFIPDCEECEFPILVEELRKT